MTFLSLFKSLYRIAKISFESALPATFLSLMELIMSFTAGEISLWPEFFVQTKGQVYVISLYIML